MRKIAPIVSIMKGNGTQRRIQWRQKSQQTDHTNEEWVCNIAQFYELAQMQDRQKERNVYSGFLTCEQPLCVTQHRRKQSHENFLSQLCNPILKEKRPSAVLATEANEDDESLYRDFLQAAEQICHSNRNKGHLLASNTIQQSSPRRRNRINVTKGKKRLQSGDEAQQSSNMIRGAGRGKRINSQISGWSNQDFVSSKIPFRSHNFIFTKCGSAIDANEPDDTAETINMFRDNKADQMSCSFLYKGREVDCENVDQKVVINADLQLYQEEVGDHTF